MNITDLMTRLGVDESAYAAGDLSVHTPIDGSEIGRVAVEDAAAIEAKIATAREAFLAWRDVPAPQRGELVRLLGAELRAHKEIYSLIFGAWFLKI